MEYEADHSASQNLCVAKLPNGDVSGMGRTSRKISQGNAPLQMAQATVVCDHYDVRDRMLLTGWKKHHETVQLLER